MKPQSAALYHYLGNDKVQNLTTAILETLHFIIPYNDQQPQTENQPEHMKQPKRSNSKESAQIKRGRRRSKHEKENER